MGQPDEPGTAGFSYNGPGLRIDGYIGDIRRMSCGCTNGETDDYRQWTWHPIGTVPTCPIDREDLD